MIDCFLFHLLFDLVWNSLFVFVSTNCPAYQIWLFFSERMIYGLDSFVWCIVIGSADSHFELTIIQDQTPIALEWMQSRLIASVARRSVGPAS